jgi:hypothetical protein
MWEPRRLTTLWAFTACYKDSFTLIALHGRTHWFDDDLQRICVTVQKKNYKYVAEGRWVRKKGPDTTGISEKIAGLRSTVHS